MPAKPTRNSGAKSPDTATLFDMGTVGGSRTGDSSAGSSPSLLKFRAMRDESALKRYAEDLPRLLIQAEVLRALIKPVSEEYQALRLRGWARTLDETAKMGHLWDKLGALYWELQPVQARIDAIHNDIPNRLKG